MSKRTEIHRKIFLFLSMGLVFFMPIAQHMLPPVILFMVINWIVEGRFVRNFPFIFREKKRLLIFSLSFLYLLYLIGMVWSDNYSYGWFDLEVKFSLLLFPLIFSTLDEQSTDGDYRRNVLWAFLAGCFTGMLILLINAFYRYSIYHVRDVFYYTGFSDSLHAGYLSMYLVFACSVLAGFFLDDLKCRKKIIRGIIVVLSLFFFTMIFLLSSKAGLLTLLMVILLVSVYIWFRKKNWLYGFIFLLIGIALFYGFSKLLPASTSRFAGVNKALRENNRQAGPARNESNADRLLVWKAALKVIIENPFTGVGTGDVKDALMLQYVKDDATAPYQLKLNAHNQYLQTFATLGVLGLLLIMILLIQPITLSLQAKDYLYFVFLLIFAFNLLVESMFEQQAGVIFFAFFNTFFFTLAGNKKVEGISVLNGKVKQ